MLSCQGIEHRDSTCTSYCQHTGHDRCSCCAHSRDPIMNGSLELPVAPWTCLDRSSGINGLAWGLSSLVRCIPGPTSPHEWLRPTAARRGQTRLLVTPRVTNASNIHQREPTFSPTTPPTPSTPSDALCPRRRPRHSHPFFLPPGTPRRGQRLTTDISDAQDPAAHGADHVNAVRMAVDAVSWSSRRLRARSRGGSGRVRSRCGGRGVGREGRGHGFEGTRWVLWCGRQSSSSMVNREWRAPFHRPVTHKLPLLLLLFISLSSSQ